MRTSILGAVVAMGLVGCGLVYRCPPHAHPVEGTHDKCYCDTGYDFVAADSGCLPAVDAGEAVGLDDAGAADAGQIACGICFPDGGHSTPCFFSDDAGHAISTVPYCKK